MYLTAEDADMLDPVAPPTPPVASDSTEEDTDKLIDTDKLLDDPGASSD